MAAPAPYLAPLTALRVPLLMSTFSGLRTQGTRGGGDMQPAVLLWAVGPLVAVWSWGSWRDQSFLNDLLQETH